MTRATAAPDPAVNPSLTGSVDPAEIAKFRPWQRAGGIAAGSSPRCTPSWCPVRLAYFRDRAAVRFGREAP